MAERIHEPEPDAEETIEQASPAAMALALGRTARGRSGNAVDAKAEAFLDEQTDLIRLQKEHLHEQRDLQLAHLRVRRWKDRMSLALQALGVLIGLALAVALGAMVWQAHEDHGLVVEAFSVPPDFAARGMTGQVVAGQLLDKLSVMQAKTDSARPARSYQNNWGEDLKLEIPETGVSLSELNRWLRQWLGSQTRVSGEVFRGPSGMTVSVRAGQDGAVFTGPESDLDKLLEQAAQALYQRTQPYRYAVWLLDHGREDEAVAALTALADSPDGDDRAWGGSVLGNTLVGRGDLAGGLERANEATQSAPEDGHAWDILAGIHGTLGHDEAALAMFERSNRLLRSHPGAMTSTARNLVAPQNDEAVAEYRGDFQSAARLGSQASRLPDYFGNVAVAKAEIVLDDGLDHDAQGADAALARARRDGIGPVDLSPAVAVADVGLERWTAAVQAAQAFDDIAAKTPGWQGGWQRLTASRTMAAYAAYAKAMAGDQSGAQAMIAATPLDCYVCLRMRGRIASAGHDWPGAAHWFAEAARQGPSLPFAYADWGQMLLARGDADGAIAKLQIAHQKGPHYADALELWGEALMRKGDFPGAAARFAEAGKYAPAWEKNRQLWRQALAKASSHG